MHAFSGLIDVIYFCNCWCVYFVHGVLQF